MNPLRKTALIFAAACALAASAFTLDLPTETINGQTYYIYRVAKKETVYSITRRLGITRDELIAANPSVSDGLREGETLLFPVDAVTAKVTENPATPVVAEEVAAEAEVTLPAEPEPATEPAAAAEVTPEPAEQTDSLRIVVILPFMLESENITKSAENFTNFYRGFILASEMLGADSRMPVKVLALDSEGSVDKIEAMMKQPELLGADFIIAPDDSLGIDAIATQADPTDAMVLNLFAVKNDAHRSHESIFQGNISHNLMYSTAIKGFCDANRDKKVILLNATDIPAEKSGFTAELASALVSEGIPYEKIDYAGKLTDENLGILTPGKDYVFIPTSHSREALMRILPALEEYRAANESASLFGYPEWIVLQGDIKDRLHRLNTTIYSRFSANPLSTEWKQVADLYESTYGTPIDRSTPVSALLGFDTASWIFRAAGAGATAPHRGVQNSFRFIRTDGGGFENSALYFINFTPAGSTEEILL